MPRHRPPSAQLSPPIAVADGELEELAAATGRAWAIRMVDALRAGDRAVNGGWPGTLREARGQLAVALSTSRAAAVTTDRLDVLARTAYASARRAWNDHAEPDPEP